MSWLHNYHNRIVSAEEAVQAVKTGDRVYLTKPIGLSALLATIEAHRRPTPIE